MDVDKKTGGKITNAEGLTDDKAWGKPSPWVDYVGPVKDQTVGIAIINHPTSFRYPTTWHVRTYGLFAANPFGWHDFGRPDKGDYTIPDGQAIEFSYRVVLHEGDTKSADVPALATAYAKPPTVEVVEELGAPQSHRRHAPASKRRSAARRGPRRATGLPTGSSGRVPSKSHRGRSMGKSGRNIRPPGPGGNPARRKPGRERVPSRSTSGGTSGRPGRGSGMPRAPGQRSVAGSATR